MPAEGSGHDRSQPGVLGQPPSAAGASPNAAARPPASIPAVAIPVDFYTRQERNRRRTRLLICGFFVFFTALGLAIDAVWDGFLTPGGEPLPCATLGAPVVGIGMSLSGYYGGGRMVMASEKT